VERFENSVDENVWAKYRWDVFLALCVPLNIRCNTYMRFAAQHNPLHMPYVPKIHNLTTTFVPHQTTIGLIWYLRRKMVVLCLRRLLVGLIPRRPGSVHVGFVVDKVALGLVFFELFGFLLSVSFHHGFPYSYTIWGMKSTLDRSISGRSSETQSYRIGMNNMNKT
jgi:hypothetical protein